MCDFKYLKVSYVCISNVCIHEYRVLNYIICVNTEQVTKIGPGRQAGNGVAMAIQVQPGDGVKFREFAGSVVKIEGTYLEGSMCSTMLINVRVYV